MSRFTILLLVVVVGPLFAGPEKPRLVVLVVFDQMRGDYLEKWKPLFGKDGFARLQTDGAWFTNCQYPYAVTTTGAGHSSMLTGCGPDVHGIVNNTWYDRETKTVVNCSESLRYQRVPAIARDLPKDELKDEVKAREDAEKKAKEKHKPAEETKTETASVTKTPKAIGNPDRLLVPTFGDSLKAATHGKGKVIGLSFKDRSAVLPVGLKADVAYWFDNTDGMIVTSTFYRDAVHSWVNDLNKARVADKWFEKVWDRVLPDYDYVKLSGPDDVFGEGKGSRQGIAFPHRIDGGLKQPGKAYYEALYNSPFGNEFLLELVKAAIVGEKLGQRDAPDLLTISFSSNDSIGHCWGPDSQEVMDVTLRADKIVADLLALLDGRVGKGKYLLCMTADHGVCPLPEVMAKRGIDARRLPFKRWMADAEVHLRNAYDPNNDAKLNWIENSTYPWIYLNHKLIANRGLDTEDVARTLASFLGKQDGVVRTFTRADFDRVPDRYDAIGRRMKKCFRPDRCGDVIFVLKPYCIPYESEYPTGTVHGTPYAYDTHVPLLVFGTDVKPGIRREEVVPATIASIFAKSLGIDPPAKAEYPSPEGLFRE